MFTGIIDTKTLSENESSPASSPNSSQQMKKKVVSLLKKIEEQDNMINSLQEQLYKGELRDD